jgi:hypothetical protein
MSGYNEVSRYKAARFFDNPKTNLTYEKTSISYVSNIVPNPLQIY